MDKIALRTLAAIGAMIRDRRRTLGLAQANLAAQIGVSRLWVSQVERGKPGASLGLVLCALAALGITLSQILDDRPDQQRSPAAAPVAFHDTETRFRLTAKAGDRQAALDILARLDQYNGEMTASEHRPL